jgi:hypothetical protein
LLYSTADEAKSVLRFVEDSDVDDAAGRAVLGTIRALALRNTPPEPQLVKDDLKRGGQYVRAVAVWLNQAITSGACPSAAYNYGAALVAESFRSNVESFGNALTSVSETASEAEIGALVEQAVTGIRGVGARLAELRGDVDG